MVNLMYANFIMANLIEMLSANWMYVVIGTVAVVLLYFLGVPLLILSTFKQPVKPKLVFWDVQKKKLPRDVKNYLVKVSPQLEKLGFESQFYVSLPDIAPNTICIMQYFKHRKYQDRAVAVCAYGSTDMGDGNEVVLQEKFVEFAADFDNEHELCTNNTQSESAYGNIPTKTVMNFPDESDIMMLYRIHRQAVKECGLNQIVREGDEQAYLRKGIEHELAQQLETGYLVRKGKYYFPTIKGAFLMTWKQLSPIKEIRRSMRTSANAKKLREWDLE